MSLLSSDSRTNYQWCKMGNANAKGKRVYNLDRILTELRKRRAKAGLDGLSTLKVGYSASYAVPVHERLDVHHNIGQAKFLEQPMRTEQSAMAKIIRNNLVGRHSTLKHAHLEAAKHLIKVSLQLVPVDTGVLRDSWFIRHTTNGG